MKKTGVQLGNIFRNQWKIPTMIYKKIQYNYLSNIPFSC